MVRQRSVGDGVLDLAVVGGGVAGAYVAWRAATARPVWRIGLFEASSRVGGRLLSLRLEGIPRVRAELGGMRFRTSQPLISGVIHALGLECARSTPCWTTTAICFDMSEVALLVLAERW